MEKNGKKSIFSDFEPIFLLFGGVVTKNAFSKMFLTFWYAFFDTNLILWQHPQQFFYDLKNPFLKIFGKLIIFFKFLVFLHHPSKFGEFSLKIGGVIICQSWPLLAPFFIRALVFVNTQMINMAAGLKYFIVHWVDSLVSRGFYGHRLEEDGHMKEKTQRQRGRCCLCRFYTKVRHIASVQGIYQDSIWTFQMILFDYKQVRFVFFSSFQVRSREDPEKPTEGEVLFLNNEHSTV